MMAANWAGGRWAGLQRKGMDPDFHRIQWEFWRMGRRGPEGYPGAPETKGEELWIFPVVVCRNEALGNTLGLCPV